MKMGDDLQCVSSELVISLKQIKHDWLSIYDSDLVFEDSGGCIGRVREHVEVALRNLVGLIGDRVGVNRARRT